MFTSCHGLHRDVGGPGLRLFGQTSLKACHCKHVTLPSIYHGETFAKSQTPKLSLVDYLIEA